MKKKKRDAEKDEGLTGGWKPPKKKCRIEDEKVEGNPLMDDWTLWWTLAIQASLKARRVEELKERMASEMSEILDRMEQREQDEIVIDIGEFWLTKVGKSAVI